MTSYNISLYAKTLDVLPQIGDVTRYVRRHQQNFNIHYISLQPTLNDSMNMLGQETSIEARVDSSAPLRKVVICCTSVPEEKRTAIASYAEEMGAIHQLDLTRDVTHLIVGNYETPKYRFVAKNRPDIIPMTTSWIEALRELWIADKEFDLMDIQRQYTLPTFHSLKFSMTGCDEPAERLEIAELVRANGATYDGDLTKSITHLISLRTEGAKYKAAKSWGLKIVSVEWLYQSLERGMILEESYFDPTMPLEKRGKGAWNRILNQESSARKKPRVENLISSESGKRKLRRAASSKLSSQQHKLWADISGSNTSFKGPSNLINRGPIQEINPKDIPVAQSKLQVPPHNKKTKHEDLTAKTGIFANCQFLLHQFPPSKMEILQNYLITNDAEILHVDAESTQLLKDTAHKPNFWRSFLIVPHDFPQEKIPKSLGSAQNFEIVTSWWVERCLHHKKFMEPLQHVIGRPFPLFPIPTIVANEITICSSAFSGIDLLHLTRAVELIGATYSDYMTPKASFLITNTINDVRKDKLNYALKWNIPIVKVEWLWDSIKAGTSLPIAVYTCLPRRVENPQPEAEKKCHAIHERTLTPLRSPVNAVSNPKIDIPKSSKLPSPPPLLNPITEHAVSNHKSVPNSEENSKSEADRVRERLVCSSRQDGAVNEKNETTSAPKDISLTAAPLERIFNYPTGGMNNAISSLLAISKNTATNPSLESSDSRKRPRILGRVKSINSNTSRATSVDSTVTHGNPVEWPTIPMNQSGTDRMGFLMNVDPTWASGPEQSQPPSTQLGYEDPDSVMARELVMARMRGDIIDVNKIRKLEKRETIQGLGESLILAPRSRKRIRSSGAN
ncbi:unnamed protein product [Blumeria hordei]|uniref:BRCT domain-containing protein n=1 Tax=Blumeria hordei TaxID=2867405 RepID=A0A383USQ4_BLUHO|nr:unnamed protein product [Blumeria hordei]